jgi:predicted DsbA family dithiol-disulfide isomerase
VPVGVAVRVSYFTDPYCPWSWAAEPALRRLQSAFDIEVRYVMAGLARDVDAPRARELALATLDAAAEAGVPADARLWLRDPPASTYPASIAVHAVAEQGAPGPYLRRLREAIMVEGRRMGGPEALLEAAREARVADLDRLRIDFGSHAILERFGADLELARSLGATTPEVRFGDEAPARGIVPGDWEAAADAAGVPRREGPTPDVEAALARFGTMTTPEVAAVCALPPQRAAAELWRLALEWRVTPRRVAGGELWAPAA